MLYKIITFTCLIILTIIYPRTGHLSFKRREKNALNNPVPTVKSKANRVYVL